MSWLRDLKNHPKLKERKLRRSQLIKRLKTLRELFLSVDIEGLLEEMNSELLDGEGEVIRSPILDEIDVMYPEELSTEELRDIMEEIVIGQPEELCSLEWEDNILTVCYYLSDLDGSDFKLIIGNEAVPLEEEAIKQALVRAFEKILEKRS